MRTKKEKNKQQKQMFEVATFAAGCFWGVEAAFRNVKGVIDTVVGYTGGVMKAPTYEDVCTDRTGHAEAVQITFDPKKVSYAQLLTLFWSLHDPTTPNRQGPDIGSQYRSCICYHSKKQQAVAEESKKQLQASPAYKRKHIVTQILPATQFYKAEEYHQRYAEKHGNVC